MRFVPLLIALCACGGAPFEQRTTCRPPQLAGVYAEDQRSCGCLEDIVEHAVTGLEDAGVTGDFTQIGVYVHAEAGSILGVGERDRVGVYHPGDPPSIELDRTMSALAEELLHHVDLAEGANPWASAEHRGWEERGWTQLADTLANRAPKCF